MKQYCGRFPVNMALTKKFGYEDFLIYRDPQVGMYAYSPSRDLEVNLQEWNMTTGRFTDIDSEWWARLINDEIFEEKFYGNLV